MDKIPFYTPLKLTYDDNCRKALVHHHLPKQAQKDDFATDHDTDNKQNIPDTCYISKQQHHMLYDSVDIFPHYQDQLHKSP